MIESIYGKIISINNNDLVINVGPINLSILIPTSDKYLNLNEGDEITIRYDSMNYREGMSHLIDIVGKLKNGDQ